jgi:polysaccharide export outer membrane protein
MKTALILITVGLTGLAGCAPAVTSPGVLPAAAPADPFVNVGDQVRVTVWRDPEFSGEIEVGADGRLAHPLYQSLTVARLPLSAVTQRLRDFLTLHQQDPEILVELVVPVSVGGAVRAPSRYRVPYGTTIMDAVAEAGGANDAGRLDRVRLVRGNSEVALDLTDQSLLYGRIPVMSGDQIFVSRRSEFNFLRDVLLPITSLGTLGVSIATLIERR